MRWIEFFDMKDLDLSLNKIRAWFLHWPNYANGVYLVDFRCFLLVRRVGHFFKYWPHFLLAGCFCILYTPTNTMPPNFSEKLAASGAENSSPAIGRGIVSRNRVWN
jgi:hypothetical protein